LKQKPAFGKFLLIKQDKVLIKIIAFKAIYSTQLIDLATQCLLTYNMVEVESGFADERNATQRCLIKEQMPVTKKDYIQVQTNTYS